MSTKCVFTNTTPIGAYRGAGRPEGNYYMERLIDTAAREMGIDRVELRRRNHIQPERDALQGRRRARPTTAAISPTLLDKALDARRLGRASPRARRESKARGKLRGRGIGDYLEVTAPPSKEMGGIRFEPDGDVTIITGTLDYGQGHCRAVRPGAERASSASRSSAIRLLQGDSDQLIAGGGTGGSQLDAWRAARRSSRPPTR